VILLALGPGLNFGYGYGNLITIEGSLVGRSWNFCGPLKTLLRIAERNGAGDEARTRNFQLGNLNFSIIDFQHLQNASEKIVETVDT